MSLKKYSFLRNNKISFKKYSLTPLRKSDIQTIRKWRNEQINVLRQETTLSVDAQLRYYNNIIQKSFYKIKPDIILFSFLYCGKCIGYGGLVHINWKVKSGEVSFVCDTNRTKSKLTYQKDFSTFLKIIFKIAFDDIHLNKLVSETYNIRPAHLKILENSGFKQIKIIKNSKNIIDGKIVDSILHERKNLG
tara:strand:- start:149 stop:721 length:573 start_codon:yes stop_codon:yes gene_type:complete